MIVISAGCRLLPAHHLTSHKGNSFSIIGGCLLRISVCTILHFYLPTFAPLSHVFGLEVPEA